MCFSISSSRDTAERKARRFLRFSSLVSTFSGGKNSGPEETQTSMGYLRMTSTGGIWTWLKICSLSRCTLDCSCWSTSDKDKIMTKWFYSLYSLSKDNTHTILYLRYILRSAEQKITCRHSHTHSYMYSVNQLLYWLQLEPYFKLCFVCNALGCNDYILYFFLQVDHHYHKKKWNTGSWHKL